MIESNNRKAVLLGEPYGTASNKLRKMILFALLKETKKDFCYRCGKKIEDISQLSVEHKSPWMSAKNPKESFYSLDNISFSHLSCNVGNANHKYPNLKVRGVNNGQHKLDLEKAGDIRNKLKNGFSVLSLAREYSVDEKTIWCIKYNKTWKQHSDIA